MRALAHGRRGVAMCVAERAYGSQGGERGRVGGVRAARAHAFLRPRMAQGGGITKGGRHVSGSDGEFPEGGRVLAVCDGVASCR